MMALTGNLPHRRLAKPAGSPDSDGKTDIVSEHDPVYE